ncbi:MAG: hypothetical protein ACMG6H_11050 [Acidobacteriota bacterium]
MNRCVPASDLCTCVVSPVVVIVNEPAHDGEYQGTGRRRDCSPGDLRGHRQNLAGWPRAAGCHDWRMAASARRQGG